VRDRRRAFLGTPVDRGREGAQLSDSVAHVEQPESDMTAVRTQAVPLGIGAWSGARSAHAAAIGTVVCTAFVLAAHQGALLNVLFPAMSLIAGVMLYQADPVAYVQFVWSLWALAPLVRRLVDYQAGWNPTSGVLLAPTVVASLAIVGALHHLPKLRRRSLLPFAIAACGVALGYSMGVMRAGLALATYNMLQWMAPIALGVHAAMHAERLSNYRSGLDRAVLLGMCIVGLYGIAQFTHPMPWDGLWMLNSGMTSIGRPAPFQVRIFSTLNSPGPLGQILSVSLLIALGSKSALRLPAMAIGAMCLALTFVRSAWLGLLIGLAVFVMLAPVRTWIRTSAVVALAIGLLVVSLSLLPTSMTAEGTELVSRRVSSLFNLAADQSYSARSGLLQLYLTEITNLPLGLGLGAAAVGVRIGGQSDLTSAFDNGLLEAVFNLGWLGSALFYGGLAMALIPAFARRRAEGNPAARAISCAVVVCLLTEAASGNVFSGVTGVALWTFLGLEAPRSTRAQQREIRR
jgi:hypothetical protein